DRRHHRGRVVLDENDIGLLAWLDAADVAVPAEGGGTTPGRPLHRVLRPYRQGGDGLALGVRLGVLPRAVRVEGVAHRGEHVAVPPDAGVVGEGDRDAVLAGLPRARVALAAARLTLGRDRDGAAG